MQDYLKENDKQEILNTIDPQEIIEQFYTKNFFDKNGQKYSKIDQVEFPNGEQYIGEIS